MLETIDSIARITKLISKAPQLWSAHPKKAPSNTINEKNEQREYAAVKNI